MVNEKKERAHICWEIIAAVATIIGVIVTICVGVSQYNSRYDSSCQAADAFQIKYDSTRNVGATSVTASAGSVWYGSWQKSGKSKTTYDYYYKKSSSSSYSYVRTLTFNGNGTSNRQGDWRLTRSKYSQMYDIKVSRTSNKTSNSVLEVDWAVDDY